MSFFRSALFGVLSAAAISGAAFAQAQPSPAAIATAREILEVKGGIGLFDTVISGVVEHHKNLLVQANPTASRDLEALAAQLRKELQPRTKDIQHEVSRAYAEQFTEAELKELLAFYKSPLGRKVSDSEPKALDLASKRVEDWAIKFAGEVTNRMRAEMKKKGHNLM
jgi:hypothetical protein